MRLKAVQNYLPSGQYLLTLSDVTVIHIRHLYIYIIIIIIYIAIGIKSFNAFYGEKIDCPFKHCQDDE